MDSPPIKPERITKPIQVLGAWLAGLLAIDSCFLFAASSMAGSWQSGALVLASILNVPLFLAAVFLLQTRFRPELQEDSYYSTYLSSKTNELIRVDKGDAHFAELRQRMSELEAQLAHRPALAGPRETEPDVTALLFGVNKYLDDKAKIQAYLKSLGVLGSSAFGGVEPPPGRNVSISQHLPKPTVRRVVQLAAELKFSTYNLFDNRAEQTDEDVLLGSYGEGGFEISR